MNEVDTLKKLLSELIEEANQDASKALQENREGDAVHSEQIADCAQELLELLQ